ncbi:ribbon-helix-helix protein, CopG family [Rhizobium leguminosarum]|nr:ribbon-helix-helix protein, CopG family [Rhizobium leguminosarum]
MTSSNAATLLQDAADRIADIPRPDLQILLRRTALRLRNATTVSMDDDVDEVLLDLASELGLTREDMMRYIIREWMEENNFLFTHELDEHRKLDGLA